MEPAGEERQAVPEQERVTPHGVATTGLVAGILALWVAPAYSMGSDGRPDFAAQAILPVVLLTGVAWSLVQARRQRRWLLPTSTFLAGFLLVVAAWSDYEQGGEEACRLDRPLPMSVGDAALRAGWGLLPLAAFVALGMGAAWMVRPLTRPVGTWALLAVFTLAAGANALLTRCF